MVGLPLSTDQRAQCFLRLSDGGLGFGSANHVAQAAFLGSWALALKDVAKSLGVNSWEGFRSRCGPLASTIADAETKLLADSGGNLQPVDWIGLLSEPKAKLQSFLSAGLQKQRLSVLRDSLSEDDQVDLRTAGGPGAGGFCEVPVLFEDEQPKTMPNQHFIISLKDRLRLSVCPPGATCQHRRRNGTLCGQPLDQWGKHALKCEVPRGKAATTVCVTSPRRSPPGSLATPLARSSGSWLGTG